MNDTEIDFEEQVRQMLNERAADIPDRLRRDPLPVTTVRPGMPVRRSRRLVHIAVAAAAVVAALAAGLVLRPDDTREISAGSVDSAAHPPGLPSAFDTRRAPFVFSVPGEPDVVVGAYLRARFPDHPVPGVVTGPVASDGAQAVATWRLTGEGSAPYGGTILLRSDDGTWGVVAATTDGVDLAGLTFDGQRVQGRITYAGIDHLASDVLDLAGEPVEGAPRPDGYPGAGYRFGTAGGSDNGSLDLDVASTDQTVVVRAQYVGGTMLSIAEFALVAPPAELRPPGSGSVVWPNEPTTADRTSAVSAASSFATEVIGRAPTTVTPDPEAAANGPTWVELVIDGAVVPLLVVPTADGWVVLQAGDIGPSFRADPPTAYADPVAGATDIDVRIDTTDGVDTRHLSAEQLAEGVAVGPDLDRLRSIIIVYRDAGGAVLAVHGGHYR
jgi:hypothetical protein